MGNIGGTPTMNTSIQNTHSHSHDGTTAVHDDSHEHHVQPAHTHPHPHPHPGHAAHPHPHPHQLPKSHWPVWMACGLGLGAVVVAIAVWWINSIQNPAPAVPGSNVLMDQMRTAAQGWTDSANVFGGKLKSEEVNGHHVVTVNSVFLPRISAGKLSELCASGNNKSSIMWVAR